MDSFLLLQLHFTIRHKMPEIFRISDRYTVLRNGEFIETGEIAKTNALAVTSVMVGGTFNNAEIYKQRQLGEEILETSEMSGPGFYNVSLSVRKGEILGITGLQGSGASEFLLSVFGQLPVFSGEIKVHGKRFDHNSIHHAMKNRIALLPASRKENSVIPDMSILENMYISEHTLSAKYPMIHVAKELERYDGQKDKLNIKAESPRDLILSLSGGNQQKVFFARWLNTDAEILLLDNPTQGIDVGAKSEIYKLILALAEEGKTILVNTQEIPELQRMADRCAIFYSGEIMKILPHEQITEHTVMLYATNAIEVEEVKQV